MDEIKAKVTNKQEIENSETSILLLFSGFSGYYNSDAKN